MWCGCNQTPMLVVQRPTPVWRDLAVNVLGSLIAVVLVGAILGRVKP